MNKKLVIIVLLTAFLSGAVYFATSTQYNDYRATIKVVLKDPGSAEFKSEQVSSSGTYCAEVNSKNSYGGYIGFDRVMSDGKSYVFFERAGVQGDGIEKTIILLGITAEALEVINKALRRKNGGENIDIPSDYESQEIALRHVFKERWSVKCSKPDNATKKETEKTALLNAREQPGLTKEELPPPMPANAEPDKYAKQGWSCKTRFTQVNNGCEKKPK